MSLANPWDMMSLVADVAAFWILKVELKKNSLKALIDAAASLYAVSGT